MLTLAEVSQRLGVHHHTIKRWQHAGLLTSHKANDKNERLYEAPASGDPRLVKRLGWRLIERELVPPTRGGAM
jgi:DNA-binding transcriptional MerR regulator